MLFLKKVEARHNGRDQQAPNRPYTGTDRRDCERDYIRYFNDPKNDPKIDYLDIGHKNATLTELSVRFSEHVRIPDGFIISTAAYRSFLRCNKLLLPISEALEDIDPDNVHQLVKVTRRIRGWIRRGHFPVDLKDQISQVYRQKFYQGESATAVAVRNSLTVEDIPIASLYSNQQSAYLNAVDLRGLLTACKNVFSSIFSERAVAYCINHNIDPLTVAVSVAVQQMVRADLACSGVNFSYDPQTGFNNVLSISSSYGLGTNIGRGGVNPDEYLLSKAALVQGCSPVIKRQLGSKLTMTIFGEGKLTSSTTEITVPGRQQIRFSLSNDELKTLGQITVEIENYFRHKEKRQCPISIEWAKDGLTEEFYILQLSFKNQRRRQFSATYTDFELIENGWTLVTGSGVGHKIVAGKARVVSDLRNISQLQPGEILVVKETIPELEPLLSRAAAFVTDRGGRCCHAAEAAQQFNVPAVLGCGNATQKIRTGDNITVVCLERDRGYVYEEQLQFRQTERLTSDLATTETDLMLSIFNPEMAFEYASLPVAGVGLVKMEFVVASNIKVHPRALLEYEGQEPELQFAVDALVTGYPSRRAYYVEKLCEGIATIAAAFYPKPVMVRASDFKSNEYAALFGGEFFEEHELNPSMGFRGASRYFSPEFEESFALECEAIRVVREEMGFDNVELVIPFVRTIEESVKLMTLMSKFGLRRGDGGLKIHLMCETPANALLIDEFLNYFDGVTIGLDDLTQLTIGVDRESRVFRQFDERNRAVLKLVHLVIDACHKRGKSVGVAGAAIAHYPDLTRLLIEEGVHNITFEPKEFYSLHRVVIDAERASLKIEDRYTSVFHEFS